MPHIRVAGIMAKPGIPEASTLVPELVGWLQERHVRVQLDEESARYIGDKDGLPRDKVQVHNYYLGGGFGRRLEVDMVKQAVQIAKLVDGPVKVVWTREQDIKHDMFRPY